MDQNMIIVNQERIAVLNGKRKIDEMIAFLASRKLEKLLAAAILARVTIPEDRRK
ncbi:MAG: hypothetical protein A4E53_03606 [Pelotomaculum sp. PtaB.Bin104]|nr:MAG: hypothetical protein A4E53_03606 [Pelotomaculum sp. PtaB.Bin104]